jgi:hypothetical protein
MAPPGHELCGVPVRRLLVSPPRVAGYAFLDDVAVRAHRQRAVWLGGREEQRQRRSSGTPAQQRRPIDPGAIEDCADVIHPHLQVSPGGQTIGHAHPALVEYQDPKVGGQASHEAREPWLLPVDLQVGNPAVH